MTVSLFHRMCGIIATRGQSSVYPNEVRSKNENCNIRWRNIHDSIRLAFLFGQTA